LHKLTKNYADLVKHLTELLKKDTPFEWTLERKESFRKIKGSLIQAPVLAIPNMEKPFSVVCDASDFAIGCALLQKDDNDNDRVISYQSRQLRPAERNYPVHDKELLAMKYAMVKFRVYLMGSKPFVIYTDHASLRTAIKTPHLSQRMARWLSFFAEFNFTVEYKPGKMNVIADALSRRPDYEEIRVLRKSTIKSTDLVERIRDAYSKDEEYQSFIEYAEGRTKRESLSKRLQARLHRLRYIDGLIYLVIEVGDQPRIVIPNDKDIRFDIIEEFHSPPYSGHFGRDKTYNMLALHYYWPKLYKDVQRYIKHCDICQRVQPNLSGKAPLKSLPIPNDCWKSISLDFIFGLPRDKDGNTGVLTIVDRFSKMVHLFPVKETITGKQTAELFLNNIFRLHGLPEDIVSDRDPRFTASFWKQLFQLLGTQLKMSTTHHPETDGQTERVNRVVEDTLRCYVGNIGSSWSHYLPMVEFAINNSVHSSTGMTPFFANTCRHPRTPAILGGTSVITFNKATIPDEQEDHGAMDIHEGIKDVKDAEFVLNVQKDDQLDHHVEVKSLPADSIAITPLDDRLVQSQKSQCTKGEKAEVAFTHERRLDNLTKGIRKQNDTMSSHSCLNDRRCLRKKNGEDEDITSSESRETLLTSGNDRSRNNKNLHVNNVVTADNFLLHNIREAIPNEVNELNYQFKGELKKFLNTKQKVINLIRDSITNSIDKQKYNADKVGRKNRQQFNINDKVLLDIKNLPKHAITNIGSNKLLPSYIGPYKIKKRYGNSYLLDIPSRMKLHPIFYVGLLKPYVGLHSPPPLQPSSSSTLQMSRPLRRHPSKFDGKFYPSISGSPSPTSSHSRHPFLDCRHHHQDLERTRSSSSKTNTIPPILRNNLEENFFHVDQIVGRRKKGNSYEYRVHWLGLPIDQDTWEPRDNLLEDIPDMIHHFDDHIDSHF
jgi:hypothetical protein